MWCRAYTTISILLNVFRISTKDEIFHICRQKLKNLTDTFSEVYRIPCDDCSHCYICKTKRALTLKLREHQAICRNQNQHSTDVDHLAISHS